MHWVSGGVVSLVGSVIVVRVWGVVYVVGDEIGKQVLQKVQSVVVGVGYSWW